MTRFEGNGGMTAFGFKATLSTASSQTITVSAQTADGSASAPSDYVAVGPATVEFAPGETTKTVIVKVRSDLAVEPNEGFFLKLSNPTVPRSPTARARARSKTTTSPHRRPARSRARVGARR